MKVTVDGAEKCYPQGITVARWMELDQVRNPEVAIIHVNDRCIPRDRLDRTVLQEGDRVQLLYFLGDS